MGSLGKKKLRVLESKEDRISRLPDDLIHKVQSFVDAKEAVQNQSSLETMEVCLDHSRFPQYEHSLYWQTSNFISRLKKHRHRKSHILQLRMCVSNNKLTTCLVKDFFSNAISRNLKNLSLELKYKHKSYKLSTLSSRLLKKLTLCVKLEDFESGSDRWDLPTLTKLCLKRPILDGIHKLPGSCLTCLSALKTLCLEDWDLSKSSFFFQFAWFNNSVCLSRCSRLSWKVWNFPALLSLELDDVEIPVNALFSKLVNLQNLTLISVHLKGVSLISFPELPNLDIRTRYPDINFWVGLTTPKLCNFTSDGIISMRLDAPELINVNMKLQGWFGNMEWIYRKQFYRRFQDMLSQLANAKNLTFDLESMRHSLRFQTALPTNLLLSVT